jgi:hypothetical protein
MRSFKFLTMDAPEFRFRSFVAKTLSSLNGMVLVRIFSLFIGWSVRPQMLAIGVFTFLFTLLLHSRIFVKEIRSLNFFV